MERVGVETTGTLQVPRTQVQLASPLDEVLLDNRVDFPVPPWHVRAGLTMAAGWSKQ